jgi:hypothetical protein
MVVFTAFACFGAWNDEKDKLFLEAGPWLKDISMLRGGEAARLWTSRATFRCSGGGGAGGATAARCRSNDGDGSGGGPMAATVTQYAAGGADGDRWRRHRRRGWRQRRLVLLC